MEKLVEPREVEPPRKDLSELGGQNDLVVFAREQNDGFGDYDSSVVTVVKELREAGADAGYEHPADVRRWIGENAAEQLALELIVGIASSAAWDALLAVLFRRKRESVRVRWMRWREPETGKEVQWFEAEGAGEDVAAALEALQSPEPRQDSSEDVAEA